MKAEANVIAEETFSNVRTVKAFNNEEAEIAKYMEKNYRILEVGKNQACWEAIYQFLITLVVFGVLGVVIYNSYQMYLEDEISVGDIFAFIAYLFAILGQVGAVAGSIGSMS